MAAPWYSSFTIPQLPPSPNLSLYLFQDKTLEQQAYSSQMQWLGVKIEDEDEDEDIGMTQKQKQNEVLRWLGECVLRGLTGVLLTTLFPELDVKAFDHLREALETKPFYAHLARVIGLHNNLTVLTYAASDSDRILGSLFASYIGAIHKDLGVTGSSNLHNWFSQLVEPYAREYRTYYERYTATPRPTANEPAASPSPPAIATAVAPGIVPMDMLNIRPVALDAKIRRQNVSMYTSRLMEYAAKNRLSQPSFAFQDNGYQGALIQWTATVGMEGEDIATAVATTKLEAKHLASREALALLQAPAGSQSSLRRAKKLTMRKMFLR